MNTFYIIITLSCFTYLIAEGAAPVQSFKNWILKPLNKLPVPIGINISDSFYCSLCLGFWIGVSYYLVTAPQILLMNWGFIMNTIMFGSIVSVSSEILSRLLKQTSFILD